MGVTWCLESIRWNTAPRESLTVKYLSSKLRQESYRGRREGGGRDDGREMEEGERIGGGWREGGRKGRRNEIEMMSEEGMTKERRRKKKCQYKS